MWRGSTQGRCWSRAVNRRAELVNNKATQEQTGPQSNQCRFNIHCPLPACGCGCRCGCAHEHARARVCDQWINQRWKEVDRIMTRPLFSSTAFPFCLSPCRCTAWRAVGVRRAMQEAALSRPSCNRCLSLGVAWCVQCSLTTVAAAPILSFHQSVFYLLISNSQEPKTSAAENSLQVSFLFPLSLALLLLFFKLCTKTRWWKPT